ncbi:MAG: hypothetical protein IJJ33_12170 [Victivallales bacterium]|nr:hypothetical protein [Victivallales bacterium]
MSFWDSILGLFGGGKKVVAPNPTASAANNTTVNRPRTKQVYEGRPTPPPEWAEGLSTTEQITQIQQHVNCKFAPHFEQKRIMSTQVGPDGNLIPEYDGIAGDCGAIKQFGKKVAQQNGLLMPYRYVDLNVAFRACCGNPMKCPFYLNAEGDNQAVNARRS